MGFAPFVGHKFVRIFGTLTVEEELVKGEYILNARLIKFALVGAVCGAFQIGVLYALVEAFGITGNLEKNVANMVAFFVSVQLNFVLSYLYTWKDRVDGTGVRRKVVSFNVMMLASLVANQAVFAIAIWFLPVVVSGIAGIIAGAVINLLVSNKVVFSRRFHNQGEVKMKESVSTISVAVVLPAYNEEANIAAVVQNSVAYLEAADWICDYRIVVVNDGSRDATPEIINELAAMNHKVIATHQPNGGYGAALRKGFTVAAGTGMGWIHFMDSDQQFRLSDLELFRPSLNQGKTFIAGYRMKRADTLERRVKGWLWTLGCSVVMGRFFTDIDCAFKLIEMRLIGNPATLKGEGSTVNAEIILRASALDAKFTHVGVNHYPRGGGKSSCEDMHFIAQSVISLMKLRFGQIALGGNNEQSGSHARMSG